MQVADSDISIVIHGPLSHSPDMPIEKCLHQARSLYPQSQIIVVTWAGEDTTRVQNHANEVLCLEQPVIPQDKYKRQRLSINAMLCAMYAALQHCNRPYVLKLRSDISPYSDAFTRRLEPVNPDEYGLLTTKIRVSNYYTRNPLRVPMLFHLGDVAHFGTLDDMRSLWSLPSLPEEWLLNQYGEPDRRLWGDWYFTTTFRVVCEQALVLSWLESCGIAVELNHVCDVNFANFQLWEKVLTQNFSIVEHQLSGITYPERFTKSGYADNSLFTQETLDEICADSSARACRVRYRRALFNHYVAGLLSISWIKAAGSKVLDIYCPFIKYMLQNFGVGK